MDVCLSLTDLDELHPRLLWSSLAAAAAAVIAERRPTWPVPLHVDLRDFPSGDEQFIMGIDGSTVSADEIRRVARTFEASRLVEMAAIAVTGLIFYHSGQEEICDVSLRGSAADYLVGDQLRLLEVAGRSYRAESEATWNQKIDRLRQREARDFYITVIEFETPSARAGYFPH